MEYDFIVLADSDEMVACPSELEAIKFIRECTDKDIIYSIYNEKTGENIIFEEDYSMIITTKKIKCNGLRPISDYFYFVEISDGKHTAIFISDGSSAISPNNYCDCQNQLGTRFVTQNGKMKVLPGWRCGTNIKEQAKEMRHFLELCFAEVITFAEIGELVYMA